LTERVYTFGSHGGLVGVLTDSGAGVPGLDAPTVLFSNIGLNHRVGPNRLYVELARNLAAAGFRSLRFDLSGFGDSEPRRDGGTDLQRAVLDTREAMDFLEKRGSRRFVLVGLCSGVDCVYRTALQDPRVAGAIFIEGYAYRNRRFWLRYWTVRNLDPARWSRYVRVRVSRLIGKPAIIDPDDKPEVFERGFPPRTQFAADLLALTRRSVKMLFIYTSNAYGCYNYRNQFHDTFGYREAIDVEFYTRADHVFSTEAHREVLLSRLVQWMQDRFPQPAHGSEIPSAEPSMSAICLVGPAALFSVSRLVNFVAENSLLIGV
jgi:pimeloyl-ACP methyl ester carboxylesterase